MFKTNAQSTGIGGRVVEAWRTYADKIQGLADAHADTLNPIQHAYIARLEEMTRHGHGTVEAGLFKGLNLQHAGNKDDHELVEKLEGQFETCIQEILLKIINKKFPGILSIGCVDGYYAMGTAVTFKPEVVHVVEPRLAGRARLMANMAINNIETDIEVDATITSTEVSQIARIYEHLLVIVDEPHLTETVINAETIEFLCRSELIIETTCMSHTMAIERIVRLLNASHHISPINKDPLGLLPLVHPDDPYNREPLVQLWSGKPNPKSWLYAVPKSTACPSCK